MRNVTSHFLPDPRSIRRALREELKKATALDMAVAFVGKDWSDILNNFSGHTRLVCWLSSGGTNPRAVAHMMAQRGFRVRQLDGMHAKVYLPRGRRVVAFVGSANLSTSALSDEEVSGQFETAILSREPRTVAEISEWFEARWNEARRITPTDIKKAQEKWDLAKLDRVRSPQRKSGQARPKTPNLPSDWRPSQKLRKLADRVHGKKPWAHSDGLERHRFFSELRPQSMSHEDLKMVIHHVAGWTGHIGAFRPALDVPIPDVRRVFARAFDDDIDIVDRIEDLAPGGRFKLLGFGVNAWSLLLYWRTPKIGIPFNVVTLKFLKDFKLQRFVGRSISPLSYRRWHSIARDLQEVLKLPSLAHVDLMAWAYARREY